MSEVTAVSKLRHPNITVFYGVTEPPEPLIITELLDCSLHEVGVSHCGLELNSIVIATFVTIIDAGECFTSLTSGCGRWSQLFAH